MNPEYMTCEECGAENSIRIKRGKKQCIECGSTEVSDDGN